MPVSHLWILKCFPNSSSEICINIIEIVIVILYMKVQRQQQTEIEWKVTRRDGPTVTSWVTLERSQYFRSGCVQCGQCRAAADRLRPAGLPGSQPGDPKLIKNSGYSGPLEISWHSSSDWQPHPVPVFLHHQHGNCKHDTTPDCGLTI